MLTLLLVRNIPWNRKHFKCTLIAFFFDFFILIYTFFIGSYLLYNDNLKQNDGFISFLRTNI